MPKNILFLHHQPPTLVLFASVLFLDFLNAGSAIRTSHLHGVAVASDANRQQPVLSKNGEEKDVSRAGVAGRTNLHNKNIFGLKEQLRTQREDGGGEEGDTSSEGDGGADTPPQSTLVYTPQLCGGIMEPHICGTSILPSYCLLDTEVGKFAQIRCPVLCKQCLDGATTVLPTTVAEPPSLDRIDGPCTNDTIPEPPVCGSVITTDACGLGSAEGLRASRICPRTCRTCDLITIPAVNRSTPCNDIREPGVCGVQIRQSACWLPGGDGEFTQRACPKLCGACNGTATAAPTPTPTSVTSTAATRTSTTTSTFITATTTTTPATTTLTSTTTSRTATGTTLTTLTTTTTGTGTATATASTTTRLTTTRSSTSRTTKTSTLSVSTTTTMTSATTTTTDTTRTITSATTTTTTVTTYTSTTTPTKTKTSTTVTSTSTTSMSTTKTSSSTTATATTATTTTTVTTATATTTTYKPSSCRGVPEAVACGSRILVSDCADVADHGVFARLHCPVMCGVDCTTTSSTASSTTATSTTETGSTTTKTSATTTTKTITATTKTSTATTKTITITTTRTTTTKTTTTKTTTTVYDPGNVDCAEFQDQCTAACETAANRNYRVAIAAKKGGKQCGGPIDCTPGDGACPTTTTTVSTTTFTQTSTTATTITTVSSTTRTSTTRTSTSRTSTTRTSTATTVTAVTSPTAKTASSTTKAAAATTTRVNAASDPMACVDDAGCNNLQPFCAAETVVGSNIRALCPVMCNTCRGANRNSTNIGTRTTSSTTSSSTGTRTESPQPAGSISTRLPSDAVSEPSSILLGGNASQTITSAENEHKKLSTGSIVAIIIGSLAFVLAVGIMCRQQACVCNITFGSPGGQEASQASFEPQRNRVVDSFQNPTYENPDAMVVSRPLQHRTSRNLVAMEEPTRYARALRLPTTAPSYGSPALPPRNNIKLELNTAEQQYEPFQPPPYASTVAAANIASPLPRRTYFELDQSAQSVREAEV